MSKWRPYTTGILISGIVLILVVLVASYVYRNFQPSSELKLGSGVFAIQVADTDAKRTNGLSGVSHLNANQGLLMVFPSDDEWGVWMKDMKIPLDIIWMDHEKKVIYIVTDASPELGTSKTFTPKDPARYVLEVTSGTVKNAGIQVGSIASFNAAGAK